MLPARPSNIERLIGPGDTFGEALMFLEAPHIVTARALADTLLLHVTKTVSFAELERAPLFARKMLAGLSRRVHTLMGDVEAYSLHSGTQRVTAYLWDAKGELSEMGQQVRLQTGKKMIASRLSLAPEHFSRILRDLGERGLIKINGREILIPDISSLRSAYSH